MAKKLFSSPVFRSRPLFSLPQVIFFLVIVGAIIIAIDLNNRAQAGRLVGSGEEALQLQVEREATRQVELQATLEYVNSDDYVASYARNEGGMIQPGERRIVPLLQEATPEPTATPPPRLTFFVRHPPPRGAGAPRPRPLSQPAECAAGA